MPVRPKKIKTPKQKQKKSDTDNRLRATVILFADIMGASEISNHLSHEHYYQFVKDFQKLFSEICKEYLLDDWYNTDEYEIKARGDEGKLMIRPNKDIKNRLYNLGEDVDVAINIALTLKRRWLSTQWNKDRINSKQLPVDLGIGIHLGQTFKDPDNESDKPEGYDINLAKRIESYSRAGRYTNIFVSGAAFGACQKNPNEPTYSFDEPQDFQPKGITRNIPVFEVKHQYLPTDWTELMSARRTGRPISDVEDVSFELLETALELNPTNIWLGEEAIRASMIKRYKKLPESEREDKIALQKAFKDARNIAGNLAAGHQKDAGMLVIQGLIDGECLEFEVEREKYDQAIKYLPQSAGAYWYKALSYSYEIAYTIEFDNSIKRNDLPEELKAKNNEDKDMVDKVIECFEKANERSFVSAWIPYDYGCELIRWAEDDEIQINKGFQMIEIALVRLPDEILEAIETEEYLDKVRNHPDFIALIDRVKSRTTKSS